MIIWFTGLSASGKSTVAEELMKLIPGSCLLDGDTIRGYTHNQDFSPKGRKAHIESVLLEAININDASHVIVSLVSPYRDSRELGKRSCKKDFLEVYMDTPLEVCKERDYKGIYTSGYTNIAGVDSVYEPPLNPEVIIKGEEPDEAARIIYRKMADMALWS